jgi:hypothetical protein
MPCPVSSNPNSSIVCGTFMLSQPNFDLSTTIRYIFSFFFISFIVHQFTYYLFEYF